MAYEGAAPIDAQPLRAPQDAGHAEADRLANAAAMGLAAVLDIHANDVHVLCVTETWFPDDSLNVLEPGKRYRQVATPGYVMQLEAEGGLYTYHGSGERFVLASDLEGSYALSRRLLRSAVGDVQGRLGVDLSEVVVQRVEPATFPDASLGVAEPGQTVVPGPTPGYNIRLLVHGVVYRYWAAGDRVVYVESFVEPVDASPH